MEQALTAHTENCWKRKHCLELAVSIHRERVFCWFLLLLLFLLAIFFYSLYAYVSCRRIIRNLWKFPFIAFCCCCFSPFAFLCVLVSLFLYIFIDYYCLCMAFFCSLFLSVAFCYPFDTTTMCECDERKKKIVALYVVFATFFVVFIYIYCIYLFFCFFSVYCFAFSLWRRR